MERTQLATTELGATGLRITRVGFGAWAIGGGGWEFGWGPQDDEQSIAAIEHALEHGINWIDAAAAYGFGRSEQVVGRALDGAGDRPYVFTKVLTAGGPRPAGGPQPSGSCAGSSRSRRSRRCSRGTRWSCARSSATCCRSASVRGSA